jgi:hypothetical protein
VGGIHFRELLLEARKRPEVGAHGRWEAWLKDHVQVSPRMARNYMRVAKWADEAPGNRQRISALTIAEVTALLTGRKAGDDAHRRKQAKQHNSNPRVPPRWTVAMRRGNGASPEHKVPDLDHIIALERGGTDDDDYLPVLCEMCHTLKARDDHAEAVHGRRAHLACAFNR